MLNSLMLRYLEASSQVQIYSVVLLGGIVPLVQYIEGVALKRGDPYILYLVAALIFCTLGGYQLHLGNQIAEIDNYILLYLIPKLRTVIRHISIEDKNIELAQSIGDEVLGYHLYWRTIRYNKLLGIWLSLGVVGLVGLAILSATGLFVAYIYYEYFFNPHPPELNFWVRSFEITVGLAIIWMMTSSVIVRFKYSTATQKYLRQNPQVRDYIHDEDNGIKKVPPKSSRKKKPSSKK